MQKADEKIYLIENALNGLVHNYSSCRLCPRECGVDRKIGEIGFCGIGNLPVVANYCLHFGEEPCLSGYSDYENDDKPTVPDQITLSEYVKMGSDPKLLLTLQKSFYQNSEATVN